MNISNIITYLALATAVVADKKFDCLRLTTCMVCAKAVPCEWSMEQQTCVRSGQMQAPPSNLTVKCVTYCPRFVPVDRTVAVEQYAYKVRVSNDKIGYLAYLDRVAGGVACSWEPDVRFAARVVRYRDDGNGTGRSGEIVCDLRWRYVFKHYVPFVSYFKIMVGVANVSLRLDDEMDRYTTFYDSNCNYMPDERCVNCMWTDSDRRYVIKQCSVPKRCEELRTPRLLPYMNSRPLHADGKGFSWGEDVQTQCDQELAVVSIEPTWTRWNAPSTNVTITVKNMAVITERFAVLSVTVAGRACTPTARAPAVREDRMRCTVHGHEPLTVEPGPVRVRFGGAHRDRALDVLRYVTFTVQSRHAFRLVAPVLRGSAGPTCGPLAGGTPLTVFGYWLHASAEAAVLVVHAGAGGARVPCTVVERHDERLVCETGPWPTPTEGVAAGVAVLFDGGMELRVPGARFAYAAEPVPLAGQALFTIASGGIVLTVRWNSLACVDPATVRLYVQRVADHGPHGRHHARCRLADVRTTECRSPGVAFNRSAAGVAAVPFRCGFDMKYADRWLHVPCEPFVTYRVHADPEFVNFDVSDDAAVADDDDDTETRLSQQAVGFSADDVDVVLPYSDTYHGLCDFRRFVQDHVACSPVDDNRSVAAGDLKTVVVYVGHAPPMIVNRTSGVPRV